MTEQRDDKTFHTIRLVEDGDDLKRGQEVVSTKKIEVDTGPPPPPPPPPPSAEE